MKATSKKFKNNSFVTALVSNLAERIENVNTNLTTFYNEINDNTNVEPIFKKRDSVFPNYSSWLPIWKRARIYWRNRKAKSPRYSFRLDWRRLQIMPEMLTTAQSLPPLLIDSGEAYLVPLLLASTRSFQPPWEWCWISKTREKTFLHWAKTVWLSSSNSRCESINNIPSYELLSVIALYMPSHVSAITPSVLQCINKSLKVIEKQRVNILESWGVVAER